MDLYRNEIKMSAMDMSETYQATASIQLRTHPTHSTINFSELGKKLLESARNGDVDEVMELISTGAPFTTDWLGASPLHYAAQYGHVQTVTTLLNAGIAKDARTKIERTALHVAAQEGHIDAVNALVSFGADVDAKDMLRMTPLHWAVQRGHRMIMEILLEHGADVGILNKFEKSPMDIAYGSGYHDFVPYLQNFRGRTKPKINPVEIPSKSMKNAIGKNRLSKPQNVNRNFASKANAHIVKQEFDDDMTLDQDGSNMSRPLEFLESISKSTKKEKDNNNMLQNVISNGQTISLTEAGKLVLNNYNKEPTGVASSNSSTANSSGKGNNANKLITIYPQSNIVLLSNNQNSKSEHSISPIKVVPKKPVFTEVKTQNGKAIPVNKLPIFQAKPGTNQVIKRYVLTNPNQSKDEEVKKLQEDIKSLKRELDDYKGLIISKDLEIEKLKKKFNVNNNDDFD